MNSKRGILGSMIVWFIVTIATVVVLFLFVISAGVVKTFDAESGVQVQGTSDIGLDNYYNLTTETSYFGWYEKHDGLIYMRYALQDGNSYDSALNELTIRRSVNAK